MRTVFDGYMGFFDGNPATLLPLTNKERAAKMELMAGGKQKLFEQIETAINNKEYQWALELTDYYLVLYKDDKTIIQYRITALTALGNAQTNPNARHYYLTSALELSGLENTGLIKPTPELVKNVPIATIFNAMAAHLNAEKSADVQKRVLFDFTDTKQQWTVEVRNGVAEVQPCNTAEPDITIQVKEQVWKELAARIRKPLPTFLSGEIKIDGGQVALLNFMKLFDIEGE